ncbi:MAG: TonB-dependent siderophore receptor [Devosia sp.]
MAKAVEPQPLADALEKFSSQSGLQLIYRAEIARGLQTHGAQAGLSAQDTLAELLRGTGLDFDFVNERTVRISPTSTRISQASAPAATAESASVEDVVVTAAPYRFLDADTSGTTNLPLPIEAVPQSITLLSADFIQAAGIRKPGDLDKYVAGMADGGEQVGRSSLQYIRGFLTSGLYSYYVDGLPTPLYYRPEYSFFDRVEIVKGPSSVTYGVANAGGLYNLVSKHAPKLTGGRLAAESGSWNSYRIEAEGGGPLNGAGSLRGVGAALYDAGDSFVHHVDHEDSGGYAGLEYSGDGKISAAIRATFTKRSNTGYDGLKSYADGRRPDVSRGFYMGDPDRNQVDEESTLLNGHADFAATESLSFSAKADYLDRSTEHYLAYAYGPIANDGTYNMAAESDDAVTRAHAASLSGLWRFPIFGREGSFLSVAATSIHTDSESLYADAANSISVNLSEGEAGLYDRVGQLALATAALFTTRNEIKLISAQSLLKLTERLSLLAGASVSDSTQRSGPADAQVTVNFDRQTSLRGGLTYEFRERSNAYVSYSDSFVPQTARDIYGHLLLPLEGSQWEAGVKSRKLDGALLLTAAAFRIEQKNSPIYVGYSPFGGGDAYRAGGEVRHQGLELEASGLVTPSVTVLAALTYLDAKIIADSNPALNDTRRTFIPRETASLFVVRGFDSGPLRGFNMGGGIRHVGSQPTTFDGSTREIDAYTVVDLIAGYTSRRWSAQLALNNLFDKDYIQGNNYRYSGSGNTIGQPRNARLRVSWEFGGAR